MNGYTDLILLDLIFITIIRFLFIGWIFYGTWTGYRIFKSDKYLAVKEMDKQVRFTKNDLKFEYKMALLDYKKTKKSKIKQRDNFCPESTGLNYSVIDDNNYLNGKFANFRPGIPYIIVIGERAIGKSQYSKVMSFYNRGVQYFSCQRLSAVDDGFIEGASKLIGISVINA